MSDFGRNVRQERERLGVTLEEISKATKISVRLLQAIEEEDFERLPGGVFNVNFVRQYARHLGLDEGSIVTEFRRLTSPEVVVADETNPRPPLPPEWIASKEAERQANQWDRSRNWLAVAVLLGSVTTVAAAYVVWSVVWSGRRSYRLEQVASVAAAPSRPVSSQVSMPPLPESVPAQPASVTNSSQAPLDTSNPDLGHAEVAHPTEEGTTRPSAQQATSPPQLAKTAPTGETGTAASVNAAAGTAPEPSAAPGSNWAEAPVRVEIQATGLVWVGAMADGKHRFETTLRAQQMRRIAGQQVVRLRVGDAAALAVTLNGQLQPALGPKGQVRTVVLTPEGMQVVTPRPRPQLDDAPPTSGESPQAAVGRFDSVASNP